MPELPEVEVNRRNLARWACGRRVVEAEPPPGTRETFGVGPRLFRRRLEGRVIDEVGRRGKWMLVALSGGAGVGIHLGMTGKIAHASPGEPAPRFTRAVFHLDDGTRVLFVDMRRFGKVWPVDRYDELLARPEIAEVGPDALADATPARLTAAATATERTIKEVLMDQRVFGGIGNIYAAEALFRARIHPASRARAVARDPKRVSRLLRAVRASLTHGLRQFDGVELPKYVEEGAPNPFLVYDRQGQPCRRCRGPLTALTLAGRTTTFCPRCQPRVTMGR